MLVELRNRCTSSVKSLGYKIQTRGWQICVQLQINIFQKVQTSQSRLSTFGPVHLCKKKLICFVDKLINITHFQQMLTWKWFFIPCPPPDDQQDVRASTKKTTSDKFLLYLAGPNLGSRRPRQYRALRRATTPKVRSGGLWAIFSHSQLLLNFPLPINAPLTHCQHHRNTHPRSLDFQLT